MAAMADANGQGFLDEQRDSYEKHMLARHIRRARQMMRMEHKVEPRDESKLKEEQELLKENESYYVLRPIDASGQIRFVPIEAFTNPEEKCGIDYIEVREYVLSEIRKGRVFTIEDIIDYRQQAETKKELEKIGELAERLHIMCLANGETYSTYEAFHDAYNFMKKTRIPVSGKLERAFLATTVE